MKSILFIFFLCFLSTVSLNAQTQKFPKRPTSSDVRSFNQQNLLLVNLSMTKDEVLEKMGGIRQFKVYPTNQMISNPHSRDLKKDSAGNSIEILWYYTDLKSADAAINKDELTPILLENNSVVGVGWGFFEDYAKRKEITIKMD